MASLQEVKERLTEAAGPWSLEKSSTMLGRAAMYTREKVLTRRLNAKSLPMPKEAEEPIGVPNGDLI